MSFHLHWNALIIVESQIDSFLDFVGFSFFQGFLKDWRIISVLKVRTKKMKVFVQNKNLPRRVSFLILQPFSLSLISIIDPHSSHRLTITFSKSKKNTLFLDIRKLVKKSLSMYLLKSHEGNEHVRESDSQVRLWWTSFFHEDLFQCITYKIWGPISMISIFLEETIYILSFL